MDLAPGLMPAVEAGHTLLAPNAELAAALSGAVDRYYRGTRREIWATPKIRDFGGWLREQQLERQLREADSPRVLTDIEERELWRSIIDTSDVGRDLLEPSGAARAARRARRALHEYGIPAAAVAEHASEETRAFLDWNRQFDARLKSLAAIGADELLKFAAPEGGGFAALEDFTIRWVDSPSWTPTARGWLETHGSMLAPQACQSSSVTQLKAASPVAELAAMAQWARDNLRQSAEFRGWICIPDLNRRRAEVIDAFDAALAPERFTLFRNQPTAPYAVAGGTALADFAPVRAALDLLSASIGPVSFVQFSALLRSPALQASPADAGAAASLDLQLRRRAPAEADLATWLAMAEQVGRSGEGISVTAIERIRAASRELDQVAGTRSGVGLGADARMGAFAMSRWVSTWVRAFELGPWASRSRWSSVEYQSAERFRELLAVLATGDAVLGSHSRRSAQSLLRRAALETLFQVQTGIPPIWISGQLMDPWLNYPGLWVSGCSSERWPPPVDPIPLLPIKVQRDYGVIAASAESQLQSAIGLQRRWQSRAAQCVFSFADAGDGHGVQSPLLPANIESMAASTSIVRPHWQALLDSAPTLERWVDEQAPPFGPGERTRGVSTLRAQSRCAFRGFAESRLAAHELEQPQPGFNDRERGDLIHHALEQIWSVLRDSATLMLITPDAQRQLLEQGITHALTQVCRHRDPGLRWRGRERVRMHLVLAKWLDAERQRQPFAVERLEQGTEIARHAGLEFSVRIDRMDQLADGARILIDYKTGLATADWRGDRPDNPQLPIYALLHPAGLAAVAYGRVNATECGFVAETERAALFKPRGRRSPLEGMETLAALTEQWSRRVERLAQDFALGHAAVAPTLKACRSCRLQSLCRVPSALESGAEEGMTPERMQSFGQSTGREQGESLERSASRDR